MSLLLDALKRAEQEKLARHDERAAAPQREAANAPNASPTITTSAASPNLPTVAPPPGLSAPKTDSAARAAQVVFEAKAPREEAARGKALLWATIGVIGIVVVSAGAYVWFSINALTPKAAAATRIRPAPLPPTSSGSIPAQEPAAMLPRIDMLTPEAAAPEPHKKAPDPTPTEQLVMNLLKESPPISAAAPLRLARSNEAPRVPSEIAAGYESLREGNLALARRNYQAALASDPTNVDAQLGLATVEARVGNRPAAAAHYRRALEIDPRNVTAMAGLASITDFSRPETLEAQLKSDLSRYPDSSALHFTLGNLYASQARWRDAQSEFFEAHRIEPAGADILYNLAVSLDNLGQAKLAGDYYRLALEAAKSGPTQFDPAPVARRLAELRP
ncbi:MAG: tetratricopeptide repeat protein [Usitatibacter sp.]